MAYSFYSMNYGPKPWQRVLVGEPNSGASIGAAGLKPAFVYVPGGGWGLRDPLVVTADYAGTAPFMQSLLESGGTYENAYRVFVPFVASISCNAPRGAAHESADGNSAWAPTTSYTKGDVIYHNGYMYRANRDITGLGSDPVDGTASTTAVHEPFPAFECEVISSGTTTASSFLTDQTFNGTATYHNFGGDNALVVMGSDGEQAQLASTDLNAGTIRLAVANGGLNTIPSVGDTVKVFCSDWTQVANSDSDIPRIANRGEGSAAFGGQSVADINRLIGWIRNKKDYLNIDPDKVVLMGSSAGGQAAGCAAWSDQGAFGGKQHHTSANQSIPQDPTKPNALVLEITQAKAERFADTSGAGYTQQGQYLSFMASLYGDARLSTAANWQAYPDEIKKSLDPYDAASRSGQMMPTALLYNLDEGYDDTRTEDQIYNGDTTFTPEVHHSYHGRVYFDKLRKTVAQGGWGQVTSRLIIRGNNNSEVRAYDESPGGDLLNNEGTEGVHYQKSTGITALKFGNYLMEFLDTVL